MSLVAGREQVLTCESRGGNPAPVLSWWLGDQQLDSEQVGGRWQWQSRRSTDLHVENCDIMNTNKLFFLLAEERDEHRPWRGRGGGGGGQDVDRGELAGALLHQGGQREGGGHNDDDKNNNGDGDVVKVIKCAVWHEALTSRVREAELSLDIQFPPAGEL